jgi:hypothetical protein
MKNYSGNDVELVGLTAKCTAKNFDIYLYKDEYDEPAWLSRVESMVDKTFDSVTHKVNDIIDFLQK